MAGHSKWAQIKRKKAVVDQKRAKEFTRLGKMIAVESRLSGGDTSLPGLRAAIDKAKAANMPLENIERAVQKGVRGNAGALTPVTYEMYGPSGVAILIETETDNPNRTVQELRQLVSAFDLTLASPGSAAWAFTPNEEGVLAPISTVTLSEADTEAVAALIEAIEGHGDVERVVTNAG